MSTSHFRGPLVNVDLSQGDREWFSNLPSGHTPDYAVYFNDFLTAQDYAASDWVVTTTEAGAGDASEALAADERCGALLLTNDAADNDLDALQSAEEFASLTAGKRLWFETKLKVLNPAQLDLFVGLAITDTTVLDATDKVGFLVADGSAVMSAVATKDSTTTTVASIATIAVSTYVTLGFYWDGVNKVKFFVNRALVGSATTNVPDDENLALTIHLQNGEAVINTATVDYFYVCQER